MRPASRRAKRAVYAPRMATFQLSKGVKYAIVLDGPYDAHDAVASAALQNLIGFGSARVVTKAETGLDPVVVVAGIKAQPGYVQSSNRKLTVFMAQWTKPDATIENAQFEDANQNWFEWKACQPLKVNQKNWTWVAPLLGVTGVVGVGSWLLARIEKARGKR